MTPDADVDPRDAIDEAIRANVAGVTEDQDSESDDDAA